MNLFSYNTSAGWVKYYMETGDILIKQNVLFWKNWEEVFLTLLY